ncbi:MAG TPA: PHP domain-containing protein [Candidatus Cryosericum sp.]|nr:PHP domain-containing protein [Candidatus Cryosericum sp.]
MQYYDLHTHTSMSDAGYPLSELVEVEKKLGYILGVSDHLFCCGIFTLRDLSDYLAELSNYSVYRGVEVNMEHHITLPDAMDDQIDYVIASVHSMPDGHGGFVPLNAYFSKRSGHTLEFTKNYSSDLNRYYLAYIIQMIEKTFSNERVDILGHATVLPPCDELHDTRFLLQWEDAVIGLCKKHGIALEISGLWHAPNMEMIRRAKDAGLRFSMGSDCHNRLQIGDLAYVERAVEEVGLTQEDFFVPRRALD